MVCALSSPVPSHPSNLGLRVLFSTAIQHTVNTPFPRQIDPPPFHLSFLRSDPKRREIQRHRKKRDNRRRQLPHRIDHPTYNSLPIPTIWSGQFHGALKKYKNQHVQQESYKQSILFLFTFLGESTTCLAINFKKLFPCVSCRASLCLRTHNDAILLLLQ